VADDTPVNADELRAELWRTIVSAVMNSREEWRRAVIAATGLPFSRIRILRRVAREPLTLTELARAATVDAPAASVAVSELEEAGYVVREVSTRDRRRKYVRITPAGLDIVNTVAAVPDPAPPALQDATLDQLLVIGEVFRAVT
jgi:DNA-binding MarR family transcriptional regulator